MLKLSSVGMEQMVSVDVMYQILIIASFKDDLQVNFKIFFGQEQLHLRWICGDLCIFALFPPDSC